MTKAEPVIRKPILIIIILLGWLGGPAVMAQTPLDIPWDDPVLRWTRVAAVLAAGLALSIATYAIFVRRGLSATVKWLLLIGVVILPLFVSLSGTAIVFEQSKKVSACATCHTMHPFVIDLTNPDSSTLAARHYQNRWIAENQCYACHTDYKLFGTVQAKLDGMGHLIRYYTGRYTLPIRIAKPHDNSICLHCHGPAKKYQKVELHRDNAADISANKLPCLECHGPVHPAPQPRAQP